MKAQKWEYLIVYVIADKVDTVDGQPVAKSDYSESDSEAVLLDNAGADGWELVTTIPTPLSGRYKLYFKKPA